MLFLASSAALVGLVHSLAPGHWLPVVLVAKGKRWPLRTALIGALVAASGHIIVSNTLGLISIAVGAHFLAGMEDRIEKYAGLMLAIFGACYAIVAYFRHSSCHDEHNHHGAAPRLKSRESPFLFLFSLGFSPCVAVLPVFAAASTRGAVSMVMAMAAFSLGVTAAMVGATYLTSLGIMKLDHPLLEHYGDVITGLAIASMGCILFFLS